MVFLRKVFASQYQLGVLSRTGQAPIGCIPGNSHWAVTTRNLSFDDRVSKGVQLANLAEDTHRERGPKQSIDCQCLVTRIVGPTTERRALGSPPLPVPKRSRGLRRNVPAAQCGEKNLAQSRLRKIFEIVDATRFNFPEADFWPRLNSGLPVQQPRQEL